MPAVVVVCWFNLVATCLFVSLCVCVVVCLCVCMFVRVICSFVGYVFVCLFVCCVGFVLLLAHKKKQAPNKNSQCVVPTKHTEDPFAKIFGNPKPGWPLGRSICQNFRKCDLKLPWLGNTHDMKTQHKTEMILFLIVSFAFI